MSWCAAIVVPDSIGRSLPALTNHGRAPDGEIGRVSEGFQQREHILRRAGDIRIFAGQQLDLPSPQGVGPRQDRAWARRPAILEALRGPLGRIAGERIDHHPPFIELDSPEGTQPVNPRGL